MQIELRTEVIEVSTDAMVELGIDWDKIMSQTDGGFEAASDSGLVTPHVASMSFA